MVSYLLINKHLIYLPSPKEIEQLTNLLVGGGDF